MRDNLRRSAALCRRFRPCLNRFYIRRGLLTFCGRWGCRRGPRPPQPFRERFTPRFTQIIQPLLGGRHVRFGPLHCRSRLVVVQQQRGRRHRLREELPKKLELVAGPGCSVCVMPVGHVDAFVKVAVQPDVITATCQDMLQVQGSRESLASIRKKGARIEVITSPRDCLELARREPDKIIVYTAVGFEATAPSVAETIHWLKSNIGDYSNCIYKGHQYINSSLNSVLAKLKDVIESATIRRQ